MFTFYLRHGHTQMFNIYIYICIFIYIYIYIFIYIYKRRFKEGLKTTLAWRFENECVVKMPCNSLGLNPCTMNSIADSASHHVWDPFPLNCPSELLSGALSAVLHTSHTMNFSRKLREPLTPEHLWWNQPLHFVHWTELVLTPLLHTRTVVN